MCDPSNAGPVAQEVREHPPPVAQHQFAVGADVDDEEHLVLVIGLFGDEHAHVVGSDKSRLHRERVQTAAGVEREAQSGGLRVDRSLHGRDEGRHSESTRVEAQEEVVHGGVAHHHHIEDVVRGSLRSAPRPSWPGC